MKQKMIDRICNAYDRIETDDPDISTERLLWQVADECGVDVGDVSEALHARLTRTAP